MLKTIIAAAAVGLPASLAGMTYADGGTAADASPAADASSAPAFVCPLTGDELPCPKCCPLDD
ncbi:hypothetical protein [Alienimonas californiensis]|uniref:Uncharacterized protein n=1 Tax=Alienimonas californiensis TaxID=2527989 RepID=A0A517PB46_9PLAN|nr:hypothetical protein [Alienimonas californiensis]QDT16589.1 hypothetical protein CA12_26950 [Alienimonas californiensis]